MAEREQLPVAEARAGNPDAWDVLFRRYQLPLYVYACELVRDEQASLDLEDFSLETISNITRTPLGTVKSRLHYAKRSLRQLLEKT